MKFIVT